MKGPFWLTVFCPLVAGHATGDAYMVAHLLRIEIVDADVGIDWVKRHADEIATRKGLVGYCALAVSDTNPYNPPPKEQLN